MSLVTTALVLDSAGVLWMSGEDRLDFLERMSTNRLSDLESGMGRATAVLSDIGRVVDFVGCFSAAEGAIVVTSALGAAPALAGHLRKYILFNDRVRITDASDQVTVFRLVGPGAAEILRSVTTVDASALPPSAWVEIGEGEESTWVLPHVPPDRSLGFDIVVPQGARSIDMRARIAGAGVGVGLADVDNYAMARIEARRPAWGYEIDGARNPLELDLREVIDFSKGCYIGQEIVARLDTYDKIQLQMVRLRSSAPMSSGDRAYTSDPGIEHAGARRKSGSVTSAARLGREWHALAIVPTAFGAALEKLVIVGDAGALTAEVVR